MKEEFITFFKLRKNRTVSLNELEKQVSGMVDYKSFADVILELEAENVLTRVKSHGENSKNPSLSFSYRINTSVLKQNLQKEIKQARIKLHTSIDLESYFYLPEEQWKKDYPSILKINHYIKKHGFPNVETPAPERSFELVGDEKWITEGCGQEILERIHVWDKFMVVPVSDPLMFAINPPLLQNANQIHLIVENKTTYQGLLPALVASPFTTLIYGCGKKIIKSIEQFHYQLPTQNSHHQFYYFGDLDREGITIWHLLSKKIEVTPALPFYEECLKRPYAFGKENHRHNTEALTAFSAYFKKVDRHLLEEMLQNGGYYPQEIIKTYELQQIWRNTTWK